MKPPSNTANAVPAHAPLGGGFSDKPRVWPTVGLTEQKLRAANKKAWMQSTNGWSDFFGRFTKLAKG